MQWGEDEDWWACLVRQTQCARRAFLRVFPAGVHLPLLARALPLATSERTSARQIRDSDGRCLGAPHTPEQRFPTGVELPVPPLPATRGAPPKGHRSSAASSRDWANAHRSPRVAGSGFRPPPARPSRSDGAFSCFRLVVANARDEAVDLGRLVPTPAWHGASGSFHSFSSPPTGGTRRTANTKQDEQSTRRHIHSTTRRQSATMSSVNSASVF